jgi:alkylation response protein AidB-like acyl-CoA dehydrogenase
MIAATLAGGPRVADTGATAALDLWGPEAADHRRAVDAQLRRELVPLLDDAEREGRFPRAAIARLAAAGRFHERWAGGPAGDAGRAVLLAEALGRAGLGGIGVGVTIHLEAALSMLLRFGAGERLGALARDALDGAAIGCVAASEDGGGSDLAAITASAAREGGGWRVRGTKAYVSVGAAADFALVVARADAPAAALEGRGVAPLVVVCVPASGRRVLHELSPAGTRSLGTVRLEFDARVPDDAVLGRPGAGMLVATWGLTFERLSSAALVVGTSELAISLATTHLHLRRRAGARLFEQQALRLRLADLAAQVAVARGALYALATTVNRRPAGCAREVAGLKVTVARLGERVVSECMHLLGAAGYLEDRSPLARLWRDVRLARLGGGTDEMMWELVAGGLRTAPEEYEAVVTWPA